MTSSNVTSSNVNQNVKSSSVTKFHQEILRQEADWVSNGILVNPNDLFDILEDRGPNLPALAVSHLTPTEVRRVNLEAVAPRAPSKPMHLRSTHGFPTTRRPENRELSTEPQPVVDEWFDQSGITIGNVANTPVKRQAARRLLYTWRDCFAKSLKDIKPTDLIFHSIDLTPDAKPVYRRGRRWTPREREFASKVFPEMEDAGIIVLASSEWGALSQFPPKKKGSIELRVVHNFIPVNKYTIKPGWPMHRIEDVIDVMIRPRYLVYFSSDASNSYWAIPMKPGDEYKTGVITPNGQYIYLRMGQGLKGACATYSQFGDMVFGPLPKVQADIEQGIQASQAMPTLIGSHGETAFTLFMDDHMGAADSFEALFDFLHLKYFPRVAFGPVYLSGHKTHVFTDSLEMVGFTGGVDGLRPAAKHREKAMSWKTPTNRAELDAMIWITPFLRICIPGRSAHVMKMKEAYLEETDIELPNQSKSIRKKWVEKDTFDWGPEQQKSFEHIKQAISDNAMSGVDEELQLHLATDASKYCLGGILFQLPGEPPGTEAIEKHKNSLKIIMFMSFKLEEAEVRYHTTEKEALAVVRCLAECRCFVIGHRYPTMLYTDHQALETILKDGTDAHGRIARWMDRLTEYDYIVHHRPCKSNIMCLADGFSRMPGYYSQNVIAEDSERLAMAVALGETEATPAGEPVSSNQANHPPIMKSHVRWRQSRWYGNLVSFMLDGPDALRDCGRNEARRIKRLSHHYRTTSQHLLYVEKGGETAKCVLPDEVGKLLAWAHDDHGHYSVAITLHKLKGQWYWPTRVMDLERFCRSCYVCQLQGPRKPSATIRSIAEFHPFAMLGMDFLGPISPRCEVTGAAYVLIVIDYFSRFVWARACENADQAAVHALWVDVIAPVFGWPVSLYTDNGSHFTGSETVSLFESHGTYLATAPISHPSSVGLVERNVQLILSQIRKWVHAKGPQARRIWGRSIPEILPNINGRLLRIHGFTPAQILLGFNPQWQHPQPEVDQATIDVTTGSEDLYLWEQHREEIRNGAILALTRHQGSLEAKQKAGWTQPKQGDLVMVRDIAKDKQHGRKLDPSWLGPRLLTSTTASGVSGYVQEMYSDKVKRYHLNDLKVYCSRDPSITDNFSSIDRSAMSLAGFPSQRAVYLQY